MRPPAAGGPVTHEEADVVRVWLIRHGQSESNAGLPSTDWRGIPLTGLGHRQAEHMRRFRAFTGLYPVPNCGVLELRYYPGESAPSLMGGSTLHLPASLAPEDPDERRAVSLT